MKYDYRDYDLPLNDGMKGVEEAYENYRELLSYK